MSQDLNLADLAPLLPMPTHGAYPTCLHLLIGRGRTVNVFASSRGERCPNCGAYVVFKCAPQDEPTGATFSIPSQGT